jgi:hypothetical protein
MPIATHGTCDEQAEGVEAMQFDKQFVIDELKKQGQSQHVQKALDELPAKVDHEQHAARTAPFLASATARPAAARTACF